MVKTINAFRQGLASLLVVLIAGYLCKRYLQSTRSRSRFPFPPGPKPKPLIGNAFEIPTQTPWITYTEWTETYGSNILHVEALGQHIFVLNSLEDAIEIMEKRASNYSSRPPLPMLELMDCVDSNVGLMPHGDLWQRHRRVFQQSFRKDVVALYEPIGARKIRQMLRGLLESPENLQLHVKTVSAAIIMAIVYGYDISAMNDKFVLIAEEATDLATKAMLPGASLVNTFPVLRHIPPWFPGAKFHQVASQVRALVYQMRNTGFDFVRENMRNGTGEPSLLRSLLEANDADGGSAEHEAILQGIAATAYGAGADTTASAVMTFFYAMATNPDVQRKAQDEIDAVIGTDRLPNSGDRSSLPYVEALYREVMRWRPAVPLGVPHTSAEDDVYKGFFIPKGSIVFANTWAMTHNENIYKDPDSFHPGRHFDGEGKLSQDDRVLVFGFGRRACAGRHLASSTIWLTIASVLATLDITKAKDSQGNDIEIEGKYTDAAISHPCPFPCSVTPRSSKSRELVDSDE
ncbi:cytochrome P450 [Infundibulicybe gibba]|nr:cytochrome P450 [Infundibulicybe gibba]